MVSFCFSCGTPCKTQKGLENHVKSRPKCLHDLGIARAESLSLSSSFPSAQLINHHSFRFEIDPNLASKRSVEVMWQDENSRQLRLHDGRLRQFHEVQTVLGYRSAVRVSHAWQSLPLSSSS
jgi:hypothetical protein